MLRLSLSQGLVPRCWLIWSDLVFCACRFGKESPQAGQQVSGSVAKVLYIQDGAEGPRGWKARPIVSFFTGTMPLYSRAQCRGHLPGFGWTSVNRCFAGKSKTVCAIKSLHMQAAELPWKEPGRGFFDLSALKDLGSNIDSFAEDFKVGASRQQHKPSAWLMSLQPSDDMVYALKRLSLVLHMAGLGECSTTSYACMPELSSLLFDVSCQISGTGIA